MIMNAVQRSLLDGADPSADVPINNCACGPTGHRLLGLCLERQADSGPSEFRVSNEDMALTRATGLRLRRSGLALVVLGREGGWPARMWMAQATPAGLMHAAQLADSLDRHGGGCNGPWSPDQRCGRCGAWRPLTITLARGRLAALPPGPEREREICASQFICPYHGRTRNAFVRTDKSCALCRELLVRSTALAVKAIG